MRSFMNSVSASLCIATAAFGIAAPAPAATLASHGHASGAQCGATDVNDSGVAAGPCSQGNTNGPTVAWVAVAGTEVSLPSLVTGGSCSASGITNGGRIIGACADLNRIAFAVSWSAISPSIAPAKLTPLPGLLGLGILADIRSAATAYNQFGAIAGTSIAGNGVRTAVVWPAGSSAPVQASARGDNCTAVDVQVQTVAGNPTILLDCPSGSGAVVPRIATPTGLLGAYVTSDLIKFPTASYCEAGSINAFSEVVGACASPGPPFERAAVWASTTAAPSVLFLPNGPNDSVGKASTGLFLNDAGHLVYQYRTSDGRSNAGFINIVVGTPNYDVPMEAPTLSPQTNVIATGLGENDLVLVMGVNAGGHGQAAVWNLAFPTVLTPVPLDGGSTGNAVSIMSSSGYVAAGSEVDSNHVVDAVVATLP
jgi:hypothetical protein